MSAVEAAKASLAGAVMAMTGIFVLLMGFFAAKEDAIVILGFVLTGFGALSMLSFLGEKTI